MHLLPLTTAAVSISTEKELSEHINDTAIIALALIWNNAPHYNLRAFLSHSATHFECSIRKINKPRKEKNAAPIVLIAQMGNHAAQKNQQQDYKYVVDTDKFACLWPDIIAKIDQYAS